MEGKSPADTRCFFQGHFVYLTLPNRYSRMQHSQSVGSMASTVSVHTMEEAFEDWSGEAPVHPTPPDQNLASWQEVPLPSNYTMPTDVGTQQYLNPPLHPSPFDTVQSMQSMEVDETGDNPHLSPPPSPHAPTEVPEGEVADYDVEEDPTAGSHIVGANTDPHPWGPPLAEEDDNDDDITLTMGGGEDMDDEVPLNSLSLQDSPNPVTSKRDITQIGQSRKSSNPAAYPQWTAGSKSNKISGEKSSGKNHPDWHHPSNNQSPDPPAGSGAASSAGRDVHPIYLAGQQRHLTQRPAPKTKAPPPSRVEGAVTKSGEISDDAILTIQKSFTLTSPPTALKHNFLMACYFLVNPENSTDVSPDVLPHPAMLGNYVLASDASLNERWGCRICSTKTHPLRFASAVDLTMHMNSDHLTIRQSDELNDLLAMNVKVRHLVGALTCIDIAKCPLPLGSENLLPKQLPHHPSGSHNPKICEHPWCYDRFGRSDEAREAEATTGPSTYTYAYRIGVDDRPN
eukprot:6179929-Amphidinium_carterae.1